MSVFWSSPTECSDAAIREARKFCDSTHKFSDLGIFFCSFVLCSGDVVLSLLSAVFGERLKSLDFHCGGWSNIYVCVCSSNRVWTNLLKTRTEVMRNNECLADLLICSMEMKERKWFLFTTKKAEKSFSLPQLFFVKKGHLLILDHFKKTNGK